jgi:5-methylcytosine-specific restriction endonuclease McrA
MVRPMNGVVLVLNQNYEPLNVCNIPRAFRLVFGAKAEVIEYAHQEIRSIRAVHRAPSVIRLQHQIRRPRPRVKLTRREIFVRDRHTCQYCGRQGNDLTLDHVLPRHRGGSHSWENLVAACRPCNHRKGGRTPDEARLRLLRQPFEPRSDLYSLFSPYLEDTRNEAWRTYLFLGRN